MRPSALSWAVCRDVNLLTARPMSWSAEMMEVSDWSVECTVKCCFAARLRGRGGLATTPATWTIVRQPAGHSSAAVSGARARLLADGRTYGPWSVRRLVGPAPTGRGTPIALRCCRRRRSPLRRPRRRPRRHRRQRRQRPAAPPAALPPVVFSAVVLAKIGQTRTSWHRRVSAR